MFDQWFSDLAVNPQPSRKALLFDKYVMDALLAANNKVVQDESQCGRFISFVANEKYAILPIAKNRSLRTSSHNGCNRLNGRFAAYQRIMKARYGDMLFTVSHDELDLDCGIPTEADISKITDKLF